MITMNRARDLYRIGNDRGLGYAPFVDVVNDDAIDSAVEAACMAGWTIRLPRFTSDDVAVLSFGSTIVAIGGDAQGRGAWAVTISEVAS